MASYRHEQARPVVVATARSVADAEMLKATLAAHGFQASAAPSAPGYPSIDFVEGVSISVRAEDEQAVRELLRRLDRGGDPA